MEIIWENNFKCIKCKKNIILLCFIFILLCGCTEKKTVKKTSIQPEGTYQADLVKDTENFITYAMDSDGENVYLLGVSKELENSANMEIIIIKSEENKSGDKSESDKIVVKGISKSSELFFKKTEKEFLILRMKEIGNYEFFILNEDGSVKKSVLLSRDENMGWKEIQLRLVQFSEEGEIYALDYNGNLCYFGRNGKLKKVVKQEQGTKIQDMVLAEGNLYFSEMVLAGEELKLGKYTTEYLQKIRHGGTAKPVYDTTNLIYYGISYLILSRDKDYDVYIRSNTDIYGYSFSTGEIELVCNWLNSDINTSGISQVLSLSNHCFYLLRDNYNNNTSNSGQQIFSLVPQEKKIQEKQILTLAVQEILPDISEMVTEYNREQNDIRIIVKDYSQFEDPVQAMHNDIISGKIPDIINMRTLNIENYSRRELLLDLTEFIKKDSEISEEDFIDSVVKALKINEKLYVLPPSFSIVALAGNHSTIKGKATWTLKDWKQLCKKTKKQEILLFGNKTREQLFYNLCNVMLDEFVNWERRTANFKKKNFEELLSFSKNFSENTEMPDPFTEIKKGNLLLWELLIGNIDQNYSFYKAIFQDMELIGYPSTQENSGISVRSYEPMLAITTKCSEPEKAFEFLKKYWSYDYQKKWADSTQEFPIRKDVLEKKLEYASATESYIDEDGEVVKKVSKTVNYGLEVHIGPLNEKDIKLLKDLIERVEYFDYENSERKNILAIILEEVKAYFDNDKTIKEIEDIIENRVKIYLSEKE